MATNTHQPICSSNSVVDGGVGVRFQVRHRGREICAFVVRYNGVPKAYLNVCAHRGVELDWEQGRFFDVQQQWLICSTHGALYDPANGQCISGPCRGAALTPVPITEHDGEIFLITRDDIGPA